MRVLVTGAGGFLAPYLLRALRAELPDAEITGTVRRAPQDRVEGVRYTDRPTAADLVFHLAGSRGVESSLADPGGDLAANVGTLLNVMECLRPPCRIVLASSCAVYGEATGEIDEETTRLRPVSPYGVSKVAAEFYLRILAPPCGFGGCIARIGNTYGPGQRRLAIFDLARRLLADGPPLRVRGRGDEVRDFVHAEDVARALILVARSGSDGVYHVASGHPRTVRSVALLIARACGIDEGQVEFDRLAEPAKVPISVPSIRRLAALGFRPEVTFEDGITETVNWVRGML